MSKRIVILDHSPTMIGGNHICQYHMRKKKITKNISTFLESIDSLRSDHISMSVFSKSSIPFLKTSSRSYECNKYQKILKYLGDPKIHLEDAHWIHYMTQIFSLNRKEKRLHVIEDNSSLSSINFQIAHLKMSQTSNKSFISDFTASLNFNIDEMIEHYLRKFNEKKKRKRINCERLNINHSR